MWETGLSVCALAVMKRREKGVGGRAAFVGQCVGMPAVAKTHSLIVHVTRHFITLCQHINI